MKTTCEVHLRCFQQILHKNILGGLSEKGTVLVHIQIDHMITQPGNGVDVLVSFFASIVVSGGQENASSRQQMPPQKLFEGTACTLTRGGF